MKYLSTKEFAERVGVQQQTVINWSNKGVFKEHHKTPGGHRCYTEEQVEQFLNGEIPFEMEEKPKTTPLDPIVMSVMGQLDDTEKKAFKLYIAELEKKNVKVAEVLEGMNDEVRLAFVKASIEPYKS